MARDIRLSTDHIELLAGHAIDSAVISARGYRTIDDLPSLAAYGFDIPKTVLPGILIPLHDIAGEVWGYQLRPNRPRLRKGRYVKYENPTGQRTRLDVSPYTAELARDKGSPLYVTEGPIKADALATAGVAAVSVSGVGAWHTADWSSLPSLRGRTVLLAFDSDSRTNPAVADQVRKLRTALAHEYGASPIELVIPGGNNKKKVGIDDYLAAGGSLDELVPDKKKNKPRRKDGEVLFDSPDGRPSYNAANLAELRRALQVDLGHGPLAGVYRQGRDAIRVPAMGEDGYQRLCPHPIGFHCDCDDGPAQRVPMSSNSLNNFLADRGWFYKVRKGAGGDKEAYEVLPPIPVCNLLVAGAYENYNLPRLSRVIHTPMVLPNKKFLTEPGYHPEYEILYLPLPGLTDMRPIPARPTVKHLAHARAILSRGLVGFPWVSDNDRVNFIGAMLIPLLQLVVPPPYPMVVINAPQRGSGKTALSKILTQLFGGVVRTEVSLDKEEMRKSITSVLASTTGPVVVFDNIGVGHPVGSEALSTLLTANVWSDRRLGVSAEATLPNNRLWAVTGNNVRLKDDLPRRSFWVNIDPGVPRPELRKFELDISKWAEHNRADIIWALLVYIRAWIVSGKRPETYEWRSDNYQRLGGVVRGILAVAGESKTSYFWSEVTEDGDDERDWGEWLEALHKIFHKRNVADPEGKEIAEELVEKLSEKPLGKEPRHGSKNWYRWSAAKRKLEAESKRNERKLQRGKLLSGAFSSADVETAMLSEPALFNAAPDYVVRAATGSRSGVGAGASGGTLRRSIAKSLQNRTGRWAGGYRVVRVGKFGPENLTHYKIEKFEG